MLLPRSMQAKCKHLCPPVGPHFAIWLDSEWANSSLYAYPEVIHSCISTFLLPDPLYSPKKAKGNNAKALTVRDFIAGFGGGQQDSTLLALPDDPVLSLPCTSLSFQVLSAWGLSPAFYFPPSKNSFPSSHSGVGSTPLSFLCKITTLFFCGTILRAQFLTQIDSRSPGDPEPHCHMSFSPTAWQQAGGMASCFHAIGNAVLCGPFSLPVIKGPSQGPSFCRGQCGHTSKRSGLPCWHDSVKCTKKWSSLILVHVLWPLH